MIGADDYISFMWTTSGMGSDVCWRRKWLTGTSVNTLTSCNLLFFLLYIIMNQLFTVKIYPLSPRNGLSVSPAGSSLPESIMTQNGWPGEFLQEDGRQNAYKRTVQKRKAVQFAFYSKTLFVSSIFTFLLLLSCKKKDNRKNRFVAVMNYCIIGL